MYMQRKTFWKGRYQNAMGSYLCRVELWETNFLLLNLNFLIFLQ